ncbi:hypothetical protein EF888_04265 [Silicimonas algicola]|uniref:hypothetical protein n=1 Tax=Silicimonas algicola TaxID=1826607 RepID=UPI000F84F526|nr:hypothetical protein [Silicimonas algicola]AZQ66416.1 hypothetical protein EF888_04265 [Silicimonas algicola]
MRFFIAGIYSLLAYGFTSSLFFGRPFQAIAFLTIWRDRLGLVYWPALLVVAIMLAAFLTKSSLRFGMPRILLPAVFVFISMSSSALLVGSFAAISRNRIVEEFKPNVEMRSSIFTSLRYARQDFKFFLHGAALKNCKPYAWSYSKMAFYELPANVAVNVLPTSWIEECSIQRTR